MELGVVSFDVLNDFKICVSEFIIILFCFFLGVNFCLCGFKKNYGELDVEFQKLFILIKN